MCKATILPTKSHRKAVSLGLSPASWAGGARILRYQDPLSVRGQGQVVQKGNDSSIAADTQDGGDDTLNIVRQMMAESEQKAAGKSAAPVQDAAQVKQPAKRVTTRSGRSALPPLYDASDRVEQRKENFPAPERHPLSSPESRFSKLRSKLIGLVSRRGSTSQNVDEESSTRQAAQPAALNAAPLAQSPHAHAATLIQRALTSVKEFRPTKKQIALFVLAVVVIWRPWLVPLLLFVALFSALIAYLTLGPDRVAELIAARWEWFQKRYPERAEIVLGKAQRGADRLDAWLAKLPEKWTDGVYLPDLGRSDADGKPLDDKPDPFDRLAAEQQAVNGGTGRA